MANWPYKSAPLRQGLTSDVFLMKKHIQVHGVGKRKKKMVVHSDIPLFLLDEIITDILKQLPVKSLIRFQCVSKHWKNLVKSPSFVADHFHHHPSNQNPCLLLFKCDGGAADSLNLFVFDSEMLSFEVQKPPSIMTCTEIIGSCNGVICVRSASYNSSLCISLFLWNPATREVRQVPGIIHDDDDYGIFYFGFGFSPILNDYKIVKIYMPHGVIKWVEVYSFSTDSWREIEFGNMESVQIFWSNAASGNGSIFCYVWKLGEERDGIVSFDMVMESFILMPMPPHFDMNSLVSKVIVHDKKLDVGK